MRLSLLVLAGYLSGCSMAGVALRGSTSFFHTIEKVHKTTQPVTKDARLAVTWVGHATAVIQIDDKVILTDPVFTDTVGQLSKRMVEPGLDPKDLPPADAVLVSHMHYDHLSLGSVEMIASKVRTMLMPPGGTAYLTDFGFPVYELRRWQAWEKNGLRVTAVPVRHLGWRSGVDGEWATESFTGYVVEYHGVKVYFGGDSAYEQPLFLETGLRFPRIDLALIPIAPIEPRDWMRRTHMDPREALQAFVDLGAARMVPIHYDTFVNSLDEPGDALRVLADAQKHVDLGPRVVAPMKIGERRVFMKAGEGPAPEEPAARPAPPPTPPPAKQEPKSSIPDEDKFE